MRTAALRTTLADEFLIEFAEIEAAAILIRETEGKFERSKIAVMLEAVNQLLKSQKDIVFMA